LDEVSTTLEATRTFLLGWRAVLAAAAMPAPVAGERKSLKGLVGTASA